MYHLFCLSSSREDAFMLFSVVVATANSWRARRMTPTQSSYSLFVCVCVWAAATKWNCFRLCAEEDEEEVEKIKQMLAHSKSGYNSRFRH